MKTATYNNMGVRIGTALIASLYILLHGRPLHLVKAVTSPSFYIALLVSFTICILIISMIHGFTILLDAHYSWRQLPLLRLVLQLIFAVMFPLLTDLILISIFFRMKGENMIDNGFLLIDFPIIIAFVIIFNLYYVIQYLIRTDLETAAFPAEQIPVPVNILGTPIIVHQQGQPFQLDASREILSFYRFGNQINIIAIDGSEYTIKDTLASIEKSLKDYGFFKINRSLILNLNFVVAFQEGEKRDTLELQFKYSIKKIINQSNKERFVVTREHISTVRDWLNQYK